MNKPITLSRQKVEELRERLYADGLSGKKHPAWVVVNESEDILKAIDSWNMKLNENCHRCQCCTNIVYGSSKFCSKDCERFTNYTCEEV